MAHLAPLSVCLRECPLQPVSCSQAILYQTCKVALSLQTSCMQSLYSPSCQGNMQFATSGEVTNLLDLPIDVTERLLLHALVQARCRGTAGGQFEYIIMAWEASPASAKRGQLHCPAGQLQLGARELEVQALSIVRVNVEAGVHDKCGPILEGDDVVQ